MSRRILIGFAAAVVVALVAGVMLGMSLRREAKTAQAPKRIAISSRSIDRTKNKPAFVVSSSWVHRTRGKIDMRVLSGKIRGAPKWPVVTWDDGGSNEPRVFTFERPTGPLRIVEASYDPNGSHLFLQAQDGYSWALDGTQVDPNKLPTDIHERMLTVQKTELGRPLDPERLPQLAKEGVAITVRYGADQKRGAVVLVGLTERLTRPIYGYLDGYSLPKPSPYSSPRPLLGPDRRFYEIDRDARRLKRAPDWSVPAGPEPQGFECSNWPGGTAGTYRACPNSISLLRPDGSKQAVLKDAGKGSYGEGLQFWSAVLPSPDGKYLLVQSADNTCLQFASFIKASGGTAEPTVASQSFSRSFAIGWLEKDVALVTAFDPGECIDNRPGGIYMVFPEWPGASEELVPIPSTDATIWR